MIRKKLKFTAVLLLVAANLFLAPGFAAAENPGSSLSISPAYINELNVLLRESFRGEETEAEEAIHVVLRGENLIRIARMYDMDADVLAALNEICDPNLIKVGQELKVQLPSEIQHTLERGDTLASLALDYGVELSALKEANNIRDSISLASHLGAEVGLEPSDSREGLDPYDLPVGMVITIPQPTRIPLPEPSVTVASRSGTASRVSTAPAMSWPVLGTITSRFGVLRSNGYHLGLDIAAPTGTPIKAAAGGTVVQAGYLGSYGQMVAIDHGNGWSTLYAHASKLLVSRGQRVSRGDTIALVGATGNATGPHVHFEVIYNGERRNPERYLPSR